MSRNPWSKTGRTTAPLMPAPRCWECAAKDERINRLEAENRRLITELIDAAADLAVRKGAPE